MLVVLRGGRAELHFKHHSQLSPIKRHNAHMTTPTKRSLFELGFDIAGLATSGAESAKSYTGAKEAATPSAALTDFDDNDNDTGDVPLDSTAGDSTAGVALRIAPRKNQYAVPWRPFARLVPWTSLDAKPWTFCAVIP